MMWVKVQGVSRRGERGEGKGEGGGGEEVEFGDQCT